MSRTATILSHAAGGTGTVAAEARNWSAALEHSGFLLRRVAGAFADTMAPDDIRLTWLCDPTHTPNPNELLGALDGTDLLVADNICSANRWPTISTAVARTLDRFAAAGNHGNIILRHHDLPWHRNPLQPAPSLPSPDTPTNTMPPHIEGAIHAPLNLRSRRELEARGYEHVVMVQKYFDFDVPQGDRVATRSALGFADTDIVLWQPTKVDERNNFAGAVRFVQALERIIPAHRIKFWCSGPVADEYQLTFDKLKSHMPIEVMVRRVANARDAYAACDAVMFPASWDRFGTVLLESIAARKPCVISGFAALGELEACGLKYFRADEPGELVKFLAKPSERFFDTNERRARMSFSIDQLPAAINTALRSLGMATP